MTYGAARISEIQTGKKCCQKKNKKDHLVAKSHFAKLWPRQIHEKTQI